MQEKKKKKKLAKCFMLSQGWGIETYMQFPTAVKIHYLAAAVFFDGFFRKLKQAMDNEQQH